MSSPIDAPLEWLDGVGPLSSGNRSQLTKPIQGENSLPLITTEGDLSAPQTISSLQEQEATSPPVTSSEGMLWWQRKRLANTAPCEVCGVPFYRSPGHRKRAKRNMCSVKCRGIAVTGEGNAAYRQGNVTIVCAWCGTSKSYTRTEAERVKTCSRSCASKLKWSTSPKKLPEIACEECSQIFKKQNRGSRFCSPTCKATGHSREMAGARNGRYRHGKQALQVDWQAVGRRPAERLCDVCKAAFKPRSRRSRYCSAECRHRDHGAKVSGTRSGRYVHGLANSPYPAGWTQTYRQQIRLRDGNRCLRCGLLREQHPRELDVHHIDYVKENLDHTNLITLCRYCHGCVHGAEASRKKWSSELFTLLRDYLSSRQPPTMFA